MAEQDDRYQRRQSFGQERAHQAEPFAPGPGRGTLTDGLRAGKVAPAEAAALFDRAIEVANTHVIELRNAIAAADSDQALGAAAPLRTAVAVAHDNIAGDPARGQMHAKTSEVADALLARAPRPSQKATTGGLLGSWHTWDREMEAWRSTRRAEHERERVGADDKEPQAETSQSTSDRTANDVDATQQTDAETPTASHADPVGASDPADPGVDAIRAEENSPIAAPTLAPAAPTHATAEQGHAAAKHGKPFAPLTVADIPLPHESIKFKFELGSGPVTGAVTLTLEPGKSGVPVDEHHLKLLKSMMAQKLNGFKMKLETAVVNGTLDAEMLDGVKVGIDVNALKVGSDRKEETLDFVTVALKLQGDVGHWFGKGVKLSLDGQVQLSLGGKLAEKFAKYTAASVARDKVKAELDTARATLEGRANLVKQLEARRKALLPGRFGPSGPAEIAELETVEKELEVVRKEIRAGASHFNVLGESLKLVEKRVASALGKIEGKIAMRIAWAMERKIVGKILGVLVKALPILNLISTIVDVVDTIRLIKHLIQNGFPHGGGDEEGDAKGGEGGAPATDTKHDDGPAKPGTDDKPGSGGPSADQGKPGKDRPASDDTDGPVSKLDSVAAAHDALPLAARRIYDAVARPGSGGPELTADEIQMIGIVIPNNLTAAEVLEITNRLRGEGTKVKTSADVFEAIDLVVREVGERKSTIRIDGVDRSDLLHPAGEKGPITEPTQVPGSAGTDGPITAPAQMPDVSGTSDTVSNVDSSDPATVVERAPESEIGHWFGMQGGQLQLTDVGAQWVEKHAGVRVRTRKGLGVLFEGQTRIEHSTDKRRPNDWTVTIEFTVNLDSTGRSVETHHFFVSPTEDGDSLGSWVDGLKYERFKEVE